MKKIKEIDVIYLAGPIQGYPNHNREAFKDAIEKLERAGYQVRHPRDLDCEEDKMKTRQEYMREDFKMILGEDREDPVDAIVLLPGWEQSLGDRHEIVVGRDIGAKILSYPEMTPVEDVPMYEAERLVYGDRNKSYGHPIQDYEATAKIWSGIILHKLKEDITAEEASLMMVGLKISRESRVSKKDNKVDGIGYWECNYRIEKERERRKKI